MKTILQIALLLFLSVCFSQNRVIDSLEKQIANYEKIDTTLVNLRQSYANKKMFLTPSDSTWLDFHLKTLDISKKLCYERGQILSNNNVGIVYHYFQSDPLTALDYYQKAYTLTEKKPEFRKYQHAILTNMGLIHYEQEDYEKAMPVFKELLKFPQRKSNNLSNIGNIFGNTNQLDSAMFYYKASIKEAELANDLIQIANVRSNLGLIQANNNLLKEAVENTNTSLQLIDSLNLELIRTPAYINAAEVFLLNNDLDKAMAYAEKSLNAGNSLNNLFTQTKALQTLSTIHERRGEYQKALERFREYQKLNDSLINADRQVEISRKEINFEADKREALAIAETERQRTIKNVSILGGIGILMISIFAFIVYRRKQKAVTDKKEAEFKATVAEVELKALRSQMNPHFIFNSLNSIGDYILKNETHAASDYLGKFAKLMRMTLENSEKSEILLSEDITLLETYLAIERKRFRGKFDYTIEVTDTLRSDEILIPPMLLQPFIENSIIHGLANKKEKGTINIHFHRDDKMLICAVDDDGIGRTKTNVSSNGIKKKSKGIAITQKRIELLNKRKNTQGSIKIIDKAQGTKVIVSLPYEEDS